MRWTLFAVVLGTGSVIGLKLIATVIEVLVR